MKERFEDLAAGKKQKTPRRRPRLRCVFWFCFALNLCILGAGCEGREQAKVVFFVGGAPHELEAWESLVKDFERESDILVGLLRQLSDTTQRWISAALAGGIEPRDALQKAEREIAALLALNAIP